MTLDELQAKLEQIEATAKARDEYSEFDFVKFEYYATGQGVVMILNNYGRTDFEFRFASFHEVPVALAHALKVAERKRS